MNRMVAESPLRRLLWFGIAMFASTGALAQSSQHNESDLAFVNRLSSKTEHLAGRLDNLFAVTGYQRTGRSARNSGGTGFGMDRSNESYGSANMNSRSGALVTETDLNRVNRKLASISRKLEKHRESLESGEELSEKQLAKRDKKIKQLDRDLENIERDIDIMENQLR